MDKQINVKLPLEDWQLIGSALLQSDQSYRRVTQILSSLSEQVNKANDPKETKNHVKTKAPKKPKSRKVAP